MVQVLSSPTELTLILFRLAVALQSQTDRRPCTMATPEAAVAEEEEELFVRPLPTRTEIRYEEVADTPNEKLLRTSHVDVMAQPDSYRTNSQKEEIMLE